MKLSATTPWRESLEARGGVRGRAGCSRRARGLTVGRACARLDARVCSGARGSVRLRDEDECGPSVLDEDDPRALMSIDEELSVVFNLSKIFWLREGKLASCIEEEEEASRAKGDSSWTARGSHDRRGEIGKKLGSRLIAHSKLVVRTKC
ncbi:hypothetical protein CRG98_021122 [Punica granatum]|uniref:Uncharacterized protein n=1 Tax=Punica granatum TaxID=22663 RepID=A0A2I0JSN4_PUNGR|nr:hypothetical protein CRG98_021122 [Punica granatum]